LKKIFFKNIKILAFFEKKFSTCTNLNFFEKNANFLGLYVEKNLLKINFPKKALKKFFKKTGNFLGLYRLKIFF